MLSEPESTDKKRKKKNKRKKQSIVKPDKEQVKLFNQFITSVFPDYQPHQLILFGDQLYDLPLEEDKIEGLNVLRPGLHLGTFKKNRFEPSHALALALTPADVLHSYDMAGDSSEVRAYLNGQTLATDGEKGWYLMTVDGYSIGWGKLAGGMIKNHYPKGLRIPM